MSKLEVIYWLAGLIGMHGKHYDEALETAIKILEQSESNEGEN